MSDVTVAISLSRKEQGALYMKSIRQAKRIKELEAGLQALADVGALHEDIGGGDEVKAAQKQAREALAGASK